MAVLAFDIGVRHDMPHMREVYERRKLVYLNPLDGSLLGSSLSELRNLGVATAHEQVTPHARVETREPRTRTHLRRVMAIQAVHLVLPRVNIMPVENGLNRARQTGRIDIHRGDESLWWLIALLCLDCVKGRVERHSNQGEQRDTPGHRQHFSYHRSPCGAASQLLCCHPWCDSHINTEFRATNGVAKDLVKNFTCDRLTKITLMFP